jgi:hypothetical protein
MRWEYATVELPPNQNEHVDILSPLGAEGWELVAITVRTFGVFAYLKRQVVRYRPRIRRV